jgi:hypothetical protein
MPLTFDGQFLFGCMNLSKTSFQHIVCANVIGDSLGFTISVLWSQSRSLSGIVLKRFISWKIYLGTDITPKMATMHGRHYGLQG